MQQCIQISTRINSSNVHMYIFVCSTLRVSSIRIFILINPIFNTFSFFFVFFFFFENQICHQLDFSLCPPYLEFFSLSALIAYTLTLHVSWPWGVTLCFYSGFTIDLFVFFLFCIRLVELVELGEFNYNQSSMTECYWKLFCVCHSLLALWCSGYDVWLRISRLGVQIHYRNF